MSETEVKSVARSRQKRSWRDARGRAKRPEVRGCGYERECADLTPPMLPRVESELLREMRGPEFTPLLDELRGAVEALGGVDTWSEVVRRMRIGPKDDPTKNAIVRAILERYAADGRAAWRTILLAIFLPGLRRMYWKKARLMRCRGDHWQDVVTTFLSVLIEAKLDLTRNDLAAWLMGETRYRVHRRGVAAVRRERRDLNLNDARLATHESPQSLAAWESTRLRLSARRAVRFLEAHLLAGHINEVEFELLIEVCVLERSLHEYAMAHGESYEASRKRKLRALARLRRHERKTSPWRRMLREQEPRVGRPKGIRKIRVPVLDAE